MRHGVALWSKPQHADDLDRCGGVLEVAARPVAAVSSEPSAAWLRHLGRPRAAEATRPRQRAGSLVSWPAMTHLVARFRTRHAERGSGGCIVRDATSGTLVRTLDAGRWTLDAGPGRVWALASGEGCFAADCGDGSVRVWRSGGDGVVLRLNEAERRTWAVAVNPDGTRVAASAGDGTVRVWEVPSGRLVWERSAHQGHIRSIAFEGSGELLITGGGEGTVRLWQVSSGELVAECAQAGGWVRCVAIEGSGARTAVGLGLGDITVHHLTAGRATAHLHGHNGRVLMLSFSGDPDRLVSAAADGTVRLWSLAEARQLAEVRVDASLHCAAFDLATSTVLAGNASGVVAITVRCERG